MELNYQAIDRAAVTLLDPDYSGRGVLDEEVLAEEYLRTAFLRLDTPILIPDDYRFFQRPEEKFPEPEKPVNHKTFPLCPEICSLCSLETKKLCLVRLVAI